MCYEDTRFKYLVPERQSHYTPDFRIEKSGGDIFIEAKGRMDAACRQKHILLKQQHPDLDLRFVFMNQNQKLYKGSDTTLAQWAEQHGFVYAHKHIPQEWLQGELNG